MPTYTTTIEQIRELTPEVREIVLRQPEEPIHFQPGQWIPLHLPVGEKPPLVRAYSLARPFGRDEGQGMRDEGKPGPASSLIPHPSSLVSDPGTLTLCLDRVPGGLGSSYLFERQPGDRLTIGAALGNFQLPQPLESDLLLIARYTGIVPFRCMLLALPEIPAGRRIRLIYGAHRPADLIYHAEFQARAEVNPQFEYYPTVFEPEPGWVGAVGAELELLARWQGMRDEGHGMRSGESGTGSDSSLIPHPASLIPMVCGLKALTRPARQFFQELGFERRSVRVEHYD